MDISWLNWFTEQWRQRLDSGRAPHAVMLTGPRGNGKRAAAAWLAATRVGRASLDDLPQVPPVVPVHPDVYWLTRLEDKQSILIDQVRALMADLALTSFEGKGKTAIIEPADLMNTAAANSLLKTLEEPSGDALIVLVVDRVGRLPATIVSRCQRIEFASPGTADAVAWLDRYSPGQDWLPLLRAAGGAPLEALRIADRQDLVESLSRDLNDVGAGRASPVEVAARWAKENPYEVLEWLARELQLVPKMAAGSVSGANTVIEQSVLQRIDSQNLFCYLDIINRLRSRPAGAFNPQTAFEGLLIDWSGGLRRLRSTDNLDTLYSAAGQARVRQRHEEA